LSVRFIAYLVLVAAALVAFAWGQWWPALVLGGAKACVVGAQFMELRAAHRAHLVAFVGGVAALVILLSIVASPG
jgi:hypothetical protein